MAGNIISKPPPRQSRIVDEIVAKIASGKLAPGTQLPPATKLQEMLDTNPVTLSLAMRYLKQHGFVRCEHRRGIFVADNPSCLCNIGLVLPYFNTGSNFITSVKTETVRLAREPAPDGLKRRFREYSMVKCSDEDIRSHHGGMFSAVEADILAGLIFTGHTEELLEEITRLNPRIACVTFRQASLPDSINIRYTGFVEKAMDTAAAHGRKRLGIITVAPAKAESYESIFEAASRRGLAVNTQFIQRVDPEYSEWAANTAELMLAKARGEIDAIVIDDDNIVPSATEGIAASGVRVPDDVLVMAHANFPHPTYSAVPAIRIGLDVRKAMQTAVELIEKQRMGRQVPECVEMPALSEEEINGKTGDRQPLSDR